MAYVKPNYRTKKELAAAVQAGVRLSPYNPADRFETTRDGVEYIEGPHYPEPHRWTAACDVRNGVIVRVR